MLFGSRPVVGLILCVSMVSLHSFSAGQTKKVSVNGLVYDLEHTDPKRRKRAAIRLGENRIQQAVPALIKLTEDFDDSVRLAAVRALMQINDPRALKAYIHLVNDPEKEIQEESIDGITGIYVVEENGFVHGVKKLANFVNPFSNDYNPLMVECYIPVSRDAINALAYLLDSSHTTIRKKVATALGILRAHPVLSTILNTLSRESANSVKVELIRAVYKIGDPSAGSALLVFIRDPDKKVRDETIFTVGRLRVKEAVPKLKELYELGVEERDKIFGIVPVSGSDVLQKRLLDALAYIGDPSCQEIFLAALGDSRESFRRFGAEGLGRVGDASVTTRVATFYLREQSESIKLAMGFALFELGREEHLVELILHLDKGDQAYYYLLELRSEEVAKLYPYIHSEKVSTKVRLLEVVGVRGDMSALPLLEQMGESENMEVASAANLAVRRIQGRYQMNRED